MLTGVWTTMGRWHDGGGASAPSDDSMSVIERQRRRTKSVGCSTGGVGTLL
jgi:hypothetical protein